MTKGILYLVWGNYNKAELQRSIDSVTALGYDYHVEVVEDKGIHLAHKPQMIEHTPFDLTCFLDTDTQVLEPIDFAFDIIKSWDIAVAHAPASSAHLAGKAIDMPVDYDLPQYNTGVIFFKKCMNNELLFNAWKHLCEQYPKSRSNDQPAFTKALHEQPFIQWYVLSRLWNYRAKMRYEAKANYGQIKIIHQR